ncbi:LAMI_0E10616g1_1 [Lachancea mirantina]|uniref:LAMI_0E10616g1_1 n=1 Tax=Lachancea mirantina TaxID=1230905 RepID=A0A1G4JP14_9SACH|nr:LAMI_0E10616g1_1 [Lachancea mirantina]
MSINSDEFFGPLLVEQAAYAIRKNVGSKDDQLEISIKALTYLKAIDMMNCPTSELFMHMISSAGLIDEKAVSASRDRFRQDNSSVNDLEIERKVVAHEYTQAITIMEAKHDDKQIERLVKTLILAQKWKILRELEKRLKSNQLVVTDKTWNLQGPVKDQTTVLLLFCGAYFLEGKYLECFKQFVLVQQETPKIVNLLANGSFSTFFTSMELVYMVSLSIIVYLPFEKLETFLQLEDMQYFLNMADVLKTSLNLLAATNFKEFLTLWNDEIQKVCRDSFFLSKQWANLTKTAHHKIIFFYLRICNVVEVSYLSSILGLDFEDVTSHVSQLISDANLNFVVKEGLVMYRGAMQMRELQAGLVKSGLQLASKMEILKARNQQVREIIQLNIISNDQNKKLSENNEAMSLKEANDSDDNV